MVNFSTVVIIRLSQTSLAGVGTGAELGKKPAYMHNSSTNYGQLVPLDNDIYFYMYIYFL